MVTDSVLLEIARISGLPFDVVEQKFRGRQPDQLGDRNVEANGNTFNNVRINVVPNWGEQILISNVTATGSIVPQGHVYIRVGDAELMVNSVAIQRAMTAVKTGANLEEIDTW